MSLKYQAFSTIEMPGSRVSRDSCPQTMLGSSWIFPIKRAEGARLDQVQRKRGRRSCFSFFPLIARRAPPVRKGKSRCVLLEISSDPFRPSTLFLSLSLSLSLSLCLSLASSFFLARFHVQFLGTSWRHSLALFREE